jgi:hypothetical protein
MMTVEELKVYVSVWSAISVQDCVLHRLMQIESTPLEKRKPYVFIDSKTLEGWGLFNSFDSKYFLRQFRKSLLTEDIKGKLGVLLVTHLGSALPIFKKYLVTRLQALYNKDFTVDISERDGYYFVSIHYHWYNRYAEKVSLFNSSVFHTRCSSLYL